MNLTFGTLSITGLQSTLRPQNALLLMTGFPDPEQAARAATNFILNIKGIPSGTAVAVTGFPTSIGTQPAIVMSDINPARGLEAHAPEVQGPTGSQRREAS